MNLRPALFALAATLGLPLTAEAQRHERAGNPTAHAREARATARCAAPLENALTLHRAGVFATVPAALREGLSLVDLRRVDVDGDGDRDVLALVDLPVDGREEDAERADEPKPDLGRGVVVAYRVAHGWRVETVASLPRAPLETAYNWGSIERRGDGRPVLHVHYSSAVAGRFERRDTPVRFDPARNALRVECAPERSVEPRANAHGAAVRGAGAVAPRAAAPRAGRVVLARR